MSTDKQGRQDIMNLLGDPKHIDSDLQDYRKAAQSASREYKRLIDKFPNEWVAIYQGKVRAQGRTFNSLMAQVDGKNLLRERTIVRFIAKNQRTMVL